MQIGDKVQLVGTVRDIVGNNVLVVTDDAMDQREYWFIGSHVKALEPAAAAPPEQPGSHVRALESAAAAPPAQPSEVPVPVTTTENVTEAETKAEAETESEAEADSEGRPQAHPAARRRR